MRIRTAKEIFNDNRKIKTVGPISKMAQLVYKTISLLSKNNLPYDKPGVIAFLESSHKLNKEEKSEILEILNSLP